MEEELQYIKSNCDVVENPSHLITENLYMVQPALIRRQYNKVLILFDDCRFTTPSGLVQLLHIMEKNSLTVASPRVSTLLASNAFSTTSPPHHHLFLCDAMQCNTDHFCQ